MTSKKHIKAPADAFPIGRVWASLHDSERKAIVDAFRKGSVDYVAAWLMIQAADFLSPPTVEPAWTQRGNRAKK